MAMEIVMDSLQKLYLVLELIAKSLYCMYISFATEHSRVVESTLTQVFVSTGKFSKVEMLFNICCQFEVLPSNFIFCP